MGDATKTKLAEEWNSNVIAIKNKKNLLSTSTSTSSLPTSTIEHKKFPDFELKKFTTFDGNINDFLESVAHDFTEKKVSSFLTDEVFCLQHLDILKGYCISIFKSFKGSQFEYLQSEYKTTYTNCAALWSKIKEICTTNVLEMSEVDDA